MKLFIISDTHFYSGSMVQRICQDCPEHVDAYIHCGDYTQKLEELRVNPLYIVAGNNDFRIKQEEMILNLGGKTIFVTHGHRYDVEFRLEYLMDKGKEVKADVILYGHTHYAYDEMIDGIKVINPGSPCIPRGYKMLPTYAILDTDTLEVTFYNSKTHEVIDIHENEKKINKEPEIVQPKKEEKPTKRSFFGWRKK